MTRSTTARRGLRAAAISAAALVAVAGCSGHGGGTTAPQHTTTGPTPTVQDPKAPLNVPNDVSVRHNVAITSCSGDTTHWQAGGTAVNTAHNAVNYRVTVFYTTAQDTVVGSAATTVTVPGAGKATWSAPANIKAGHELRCVLRGVAVAG